MFQIAQQLSMCAGEIYGALLVYSIKFILRSQRAAHSMNKLITSLQIVQKCIKWELHNLMNQSTMQKPTEIKKNLLNYTCESLFSL